MSRQVQMPEQTLEGVLPIYKPANYTSHDIVAIVRRRLGMKRVGHTGTLDPLVTGVLPLCVGRATRVAEYLLDLPKQYEATVRFGIATDTYDLSGQIVAEERNVQLTKKQVEQALSSMVGTIKQVPPMYSAVKVDGKKLYELARSGQVVPREARDVTIFQLEVLDMQFEEKHPMVRFRIDCSKGTYIRSFCHDLGQRLSVPAAMDSLVRTRSGAIGLDQCIHLEQLEQLEPSDYGQIEPYFLQTDKAIGHIQAGKLKDDEWRQRALFGQRIPVTAVTFTPPTFFMQAHDDLVRLYDNSESFLGIYRLDEQVEQIVPVKVFS